MYPSEMGNLSLTLFLTKYVKDIKYIHSITQDQYRDSPGQEELLLDGGRDFISVKRDTHHNVYMICQNAGADTERWMYCETTEESHPFDIMSAIKLAKMFSDEKEIKADDMDIHADSVEEFDKLVAEDYNHKDFVGDNETI